MSSEQGELPIEVGKPVKRRRKIIAVRKTRGGDRIVVTSDGKEKRYFIGKRLHQAKPCAK